jgi:hypothetical protein
MIHDRESSSILKWHMRSSNSFENVLFFHAKYYADISGSRRRYVSDFFVRNYDSKNFIFDKFHNSSPRTEHENLKNCYVKSTSWNTPTLPSNRFCEFLDRRGALVLFGVFPLWHGVWAASRDKIPETPITKIDTEKCMISIIWSISGIHSLLALIKEMKYNSQYFCQHVIPDIHIQQNIC